MLPLPEIIELTPVPESGIAFTIEPLHDNYRYGKKLTE
jgi:hypothetical protein